MKCYKCGQQEASVAVKKTAMFLGHEVTRFYCAVCFNNGAWKQD